MAKKSAEERINQEENRETKGSEADVIKVTEDKEDPEIAMMDSPVSMETMKTIRMACKSTPDSALGKHTDITDNL